MHEHNLGLTTDELISLQRLIGHHTTGNALERVYDRLHDMCTRINIDGHHTPPFPKDLDPNPMYKDRDMVKVNRS